MPYKIRKTVAAVGLFLILSFVLVAILAVQFEVLVPPIAIPDTQFEVVIRTIVVPDDYSTIQEAIDAASEGDVIFVKKGMYNETLKIEKALTLRGEDVKATIINGNLSETVVLIQHNRVTVTGFTIRYAPESYSPGPMELGYSRLAEIHILYANYCRVYGNRLSDGGCGVWLYGASENNITGNTIIRNDNGIRVDYSDNNIIVGNVVENNYYGIWLKSASGNRLRDNSVSDSDGRNFGVTGSEFSTYVNDVDSSNTLDGKPIYYWLNVSDRSVPSDAGCVVLVNCTGITVQGLTLRKNLYGLLLVFTEDSVVLNNTFGGNRISVYLLNCSNIDVIGNIIGGTNGISSKSNWVRIKNNTITSYSTGINVAGLYNAITNNNVTVTMFNILKCSGSFNNITQNIFSGTNPNALLDLGGSDNIFHENLITGKRELSVTGERNTVSKNAITNTGLSVSGSWHIVQANKITGCVQIYESIKRFALSISSSNSVYSANIIENNDYGVRLLGPKEIVYGNVFYHNSIIDNEQQTIFEKAKNNANFWDNGIKGNYWSDYNGTDSDGDGIGDTPYIIDENNQDNYPLVNPVDIEAIPEFP
jgi:parallel beta-helix repeat protein